MNCTHCTIQTVTFPVLPARASSKTLISPFLAQVYPKSTFKNAHQTLKLTSFKVRASLDNSGDTNNWVSRLPIGALSGDKIFKLISGATASPIGQFISSPTTFLHSVDPRIKLVNKKFGFLMPVLCSGHFFFSFVFLQFFFYWIRSGLADIWVISFFLDYFGEICLI